MIVAWRSLEPGGRREYFFKLAVQQIKNWEKKINKIRSPYLKKNLFFSDEILSARVFQLGGRSNGYAYKILSRILPWNYKNMQTKFKNSIKLFFFKQHWNRQQDSMTTQVRSFASGLVCLKHRILLKKWADDRRCKVSLFNYYEFGNHVNRRVLTFLF